MKNDFGLDADSWRGGLIALVLVGLLLGGFLLFAYHGMRPDRASIQVPWGDGKAAESRSQTPPNPSTAAPAAAAATGPSHVDGAARTASARADTSTPVAGALRNVLQEFQHGDPKRTATVSISTDGKIHSEGSVDRTVLDGLPERAVSEGTMMTGGSGGR